MPISRNFIFVLFSLLIVVGDASAASSDEPLSVIAFGSCNREYEDQSFWPTIAAQNPDLWVWLGDNIYADTEDMGLMAEKYRRQKSNTHYRRFISTVPVVGIWDDHDYGVNDGNRLFAKQPESKAQLLNFLDVPESHPVHQQTGVYQSYSYGKPGSKVKLILLDTRSFQDPLVKLPRGSAKNYQSQPEGQLLGADQWAWLDQELADSDADIHLIASSLQVIPQDHRFEMWFNFPKQREKLFDLLVEKQVKNPIFLSGDRHLSEVSRLEWEGKTFYDITSSGMTHSYTNGSAEPNRHRVTRLITEKSFATMTFDWQEKRLLVRHLSPQGALHLEYTIPLQ